MFISSTAISQQIRQLEEQLEVSYSNDNIER